MYKSRARLDIRKYAFSNRVVNTWNSLPENVISAKTLFTFEAGLEQFWKKSGYMYLVQLWWYL